MRLQRRLASQVKGVGRNRIKFPVSQLEEIEDALTRAQVKRLIKDGVIVVEKKRGISSARLKERKEKQRKKSERKGPGSRKGKRREGKKERWVSTIRKVRRYLRWLRDNGRIPREVYRDYYDKSKGGVFKSVADVRRSLVSSGYLKEVT
ncbi:50S ribosomal protein L19e [Sulfodiicoccus acidiphilus]|nr:50S ribosomal protein L19e [Sulfodiicoccus acidiphilus]